MAELKVEYRVREVTRYHVTRHYSSLDERTGGTEQKGEYDNPNIAYEVAYALAKEEHSRLGYPLDDERIKYPDPCGPGGLAHGMAVLGQVSAVSPPYGEQLTAARVAKP